MTLYVTYVMHVVLFYGQCPIKRIAQAGWLLDEVIRSITTPPGWDASPSHGYSQHSSITTPPGLDASPSQGYAQHMYYYSPLDGMLVHHNKPSILFGFPILHWHPFVHLGQAQLFLSSEKAG